MTEQRPRLLEAIEAEPGIHFNELARRLDLATGQVQYHLRKLQRADRVVAHECRGRTHYFRPEFDAVDRTAIARLRRETTRDVVVYLLEHGPSRPGPMAKQLAIARSTLEWHLEDLIEQDLVEKRRDQRNRVTVVLARPTETVRLLHFVEPSLPDRLVDRFTRLIDRLLAE